MEQTWLAGFAQWLRDVTPVPAMQAAIAVVLTAIAAKLVRAAIRVGLDPLVRRLLPAADRLADVAGQAAARSILLGGALVAAVTLAPDREAELWLVAAARTLLVITWVVASVQGATALLAGLSASPTAPAWAAPSAVPLLNNLLRVSVTLVAIYAVLVSWDVDVTGLVASAGLLGIALSFAAQDTLSNLFAGAAIMVDQPYRVGDYIVLDTGERGQVTYVGLRSTRLVTRDDEEISIPNGVIGRAKIINESGGPEARFRLRVRVGVAYGSDIDHVMAVLLGVAAAHPMVSRHPEPRVRLRAFGESAVEFELLAWITNPAQRGLVLHELHCEVYRAFAREAITIPLPQRELHVRDGRADAAD